MSRGTGGRHGVLAALAAVLLAVTGVAALTLARAAAHEPPRPTASQAGTLPITIPAHAQAQPGAGHLAAPVQPVRVGPVMSRSRPVSIDIPAVDIHAGLLQLGLDAQGALRPPWKPLLAGWYTGSVTPGQAGPAVLAGHVDSWETGPAVFYRLGALELGRAIVVTRADGSQAIFTVDAVREYSKASFPTQTVYGDTARAELRLITCGSWDASHQQYNGNTVVFAHLVSFTPAG